MLLTYAELSFLVSLRDAAPSMSGPELSLLDLLEQPVRCPDEVIASGRASLIARELCRVHDDVEPAGSAGAGSVAGSVELELDPEIVELHAAIHGATTSVRIATVGPERCTFWLLLAGDGRAAFTPVDRGVFGVVVVPDTGELRAQVASLITSALVDDPFAGVALTRGGHYDAMSFRTNDEFGGPYASPARRRLAVESLVDSVFVRPQPSHGHPSHG